MTGPERIRTLHLINQLGYGGTERQLSLLLTHMDPDRFEHRVVVLNPSPHRSYDEELERQGVSVRVMPRSCRGPLKRLLFLVRESRKYRPRVMHSWTLHDNPYAGFAGWASRTPVRWGSVRLSLQSAGFLTLSRFVRRLCIQSVQRQVVNSRVLVAELSASGLRPDRILFLPNCVREHRAEQAADLSALGISAEAPVVGIVGNLRPAKNHGLFVRSMARVVASRPQIRAVIVGQSIPGEERYEDALKEEIERLGLDRHIVLTGFRDDVPEILERMSVFCLTSDQEGLPNVVLEAMAAARPVVACRAGGVAEVLEDGRHGYLIAPDDEEGMALAVGRLLDHPESAHRMGEAGRDRVERERSCTALASRLADEYRTALDVRR